MISAQQNLEYAQVGQGTPAGKLLRQYWQPVAVARELEERNPLPIKVLGEELALFRDKSGRPGLVDDRCAHRGASLSKGSEALRTVRLDDRGIRCCYHGWLYDTDGQCLEMPTEPDLGAKFCKNIQLKSYPTEEKYGFIWAFMGEGDPPCVPAYDVLADDALLKIQNKKLWHCNYFQLFENFADPAHTAVLHEDTDVEAAFGEVPEIRTESSPHGLSVIARREKYERLSEIVFPTACRFVIPLPELFTDALFWYVPVDDQTTYSYHTMVPRDITRENRQEKIQQLESFLMRNGIDVLHHEDRIGDQDSFAIESQGAIADRSLEHLGKSDQAIVDLRKVYKQAMDDVASGQPPIGTVTDASVTRIEFGGVR